MLLLGDRFYPSTGLFAWLNQHDWQYRLRLKANLTVDTGFCEATTGELAAGVTERYLPEVRLFHSGVSTNLGIWQEAGHEAPWIIAMDCWPTRPRCWMMARAGRLNRGFPTLRVGGFN